MAGMHTIQTLMTPLKLVPFTAEPVDMAVPLDVTKTLAKSGDKGLDLKGQDLKSAFDLFNEMSQQLTDSYFMLENRVAELNQELNTVADQRMQELAEKEKLANRLENLLNFLPGGVVVLDSSGRISECNPAAIDLLGEPLQGELLRDVIGR